MELGDFSQLAKEYIHRTGYSLSTLKALQAYVKQSVNKTSVVVADVGAGTGKLTENLSEIGLTGFAVEPNDAMRAEGQYLFSGNSQFIWSKGTGEKTGLLDHSVDWVLMASSFHWTNAALALKEFKRILKPKGFFTALWNPRDLDKSTLHLKIEDKIHEMLPELKRVSSGAKSYTKDIESNLTSTGDFKDVLFIESQHEVQMEKPRYLGAWRSVNDIQAQAGPEKFQQILNMIENEIKDFDFVKVPYRTRSWTVQLK
ncbi:MAG: class I SAM-dependent methyltransferase [Pseudomonadota bacterium]|nr:class I SAM-dependent methyltransferase [Pseudomonadota bacterium]